MRRKTIPLVHWPEPSVRSVLLPDEWLACLESWILAVEMRLRLPSMQFSELSSSSTTLGIAFVEAYIYDQEHENTPGPDQSSYSPETKLWRATFLLTRRIMLEIEAKEHLLKNEVLAFFSKFCIVYRSISTLKQTIEHAWRKNSFDLSAAVHRAKSAAIALLSPAKEHDISAILELLRHYSILTRILPEVGLVWLTGSDFLEGLDSTYDHVQNSTQPHQEVLLALKTSLYNSLLALVEVQPPQTSLLFDHLYALKKFQENHMINGRKTPTLLANVLCSTALLKRLDQLVSGSHQKRGTDILNDFKEYRARGISLHPSFRRHKLRSKNKGKSKALSNSDAFDMNSLALISQVQDLFPDLSAEYISKLLTHFSDDVEAVTAALLEPESLPSALSQESYEANASDDVSLPTKRAVPTTNNRRNIFDGDDFSALRISSSQLHHGKRDERPSYDVPSAANSGLKAAVFSALAGFDSDSDERDDTYDMADVGGTVDSTLPGTDDAEAQPIKRDLQSKQEQDFRQSQENDLLLFRAWKSDQSTFLRDSKTRLSQPRTQLKRETDWTDEQIEGWAIMLQKDQGRIDRLERTLVLGGGTANSARQSALDRTAWVAADVETGTEGTGIPPQNSGSVHRGDRGPYRGKAGDVAGPTRDSATQAARRRKEQGKSGRGGSNHGRREGRARKMGRGFGAPP